MSDISLAIEMLEQGHREDAVRELEKILSQDIDHIAAWRLLAQAVTNPNEIKECYEHVLRLDPHDPEAIQALRSLDTPQRPAGELPFYHEDLSELDSGWQGPVEPPVQPGIDTSPLKLAEAEMAPYPQAPEKEEAPQPPPAAWPSEAESVLFDEEEPPRPSVQEEKGGLLDNDVLFYPLILIVIVAVAAILFFLFRTPLLTLLNNLLP